MIHREIYGCLRRNAVRLCGDSLVLWLEEADKLNSFETSVVCFTLITILLVSLRKLLLPESFDVYTAISKRHRDVVYGQHISSKVKEFCSYQ